MVSDMDGATLRKIAGLPAARPDQILTTELVKTLAESDSTVLHFGLTDENNVKVACIEIARAGVPVDMEYFMGIYYFNFKNKKAHDKALKAILPKIDTSKEDEFKPKAPK